MFKVSSRVRAASVSLLAVSALVLTGCTGSDETRDAAELSTLPESATAAIDEAVGNAMQWSRSSEAIVGVWSSSGEYVGGFTGDESQPLDGNSQFRGAQTTQPMMCALLLDLASEDAALLSLDREVAEDLPRQTGIEGITYRQLCDGTSGLPDFKGPYTNIFVTNPTRDWAPGEWIAESLIRDRLSWPGLDVHRSDTNAVLLGQALKVVTGESVADLLSERVFEPAGMQNSYQPRSNELTLRGSSAMHGTTFLPGPQCDAGVIELTEVSPTILGSAGATVTTANDLKRFYEGYLGGMFGGEELSTVITDGKPTTNPERDENGTPTSEVAEDSDQRGFGVVSVGPLWGYNGSMPGTASAAYHDSASGFTVVVSLNNSTVGAGFANRLALQLTAIVGEETGAIDVPWSAEDQSAKLSEAAICQDVAEGE